MSCFYFSRLCRRLLCLQADMALRGKVTKWILKQDPEDSNWQFTYFINATESYIRK